MPDSVPGLPEGFKLAVAHPADPGDYLDETEIKIPKEENANRVSEEKESKAEEIGENKREGDISSNLSGTECPISNSEKSIEASLVKSTRPKRKQVNMNQATLDKLSELVELVRDFSQQQDAAASEIVDAIISMVHDSRDSINLSKVPPRGRWGTPTAQAFKDALGRAFVKAVVEVASK